jgi:hypothetical protein
MESFKGNESALRAMEQADLVTLTIQDARRRTIHVGKPVYKWVFKRLVEGDTTFPNRDGCSCYLF